MPNWKRRKSYFQFLKEPKPAQLLSLFCFVVCKHQQGLQLRCVDVPLGGWSPVSSPLAVLLLAFLLISGGSLGFFFW